MLKNVTLSEMHKIYSAIDEQGNTWRWKVIIENWNKRRKNPRIKIIIAPNGLSDKNAIKIVKNVLSL